MSQVWLYLRFQKKISSFEKEITVMVWYFDTIQQRILQRIFSKEFWENRKSVYVMFCAIWYHLSKPAILLKVTLLQGCFSRFLNWINGTKSRNASHILEYFDLPYPNFREREHLVLTSLKYCQTNKQLLKKNCSRRIAR